MGQTITDNISGCLRVDANLPALTRAGKANANVFPDPVGAIPTKSLFSKRSFIDLH